jgi:hypothetical protein
MPQRLRESKNFFALEEQFRCEKKAAAAAAKTSDGKKAGFKLPSLFIETAATIGRDQDGRPIAQSYFDKDKGWRFVRREVNRRNRAASKKLVRAKSEEAQKAARQEIDKANRYKVQANWLHQRMKDAEKFHPKGGFAFRRAILAAVKEAECCHQSTSGKIRHAIREEGFERHMQRVFREVNSEFGIPVQPDTAPPLDCTTVRERVEKEFKPPSNRRQLAYSDSLIRKANMRQRNSPIARPKSISPALEAALARGQKNWGSYPGMPEDMPDLPPSSPKNEPPPSPLKE